MPGRTLGARGVVVAVACMLLGACTTSPPVQEMSDARQAIAVAAGSNAAELAPDLFADAQRLLGLAESQIRDEAYGRARASALRAKVRAQRALERAADAETAIDP